ncbi:MAG: PAS domain-containing sensor histidine kinase [Methylococcaceae bacterium]|nr:PAS domain-containing sensor histidine kinase [Methylococcaceae bacterium]
MLIQFFQKFSHATSEPWCLLSLNGDILALNPAMVEFIDCSQQQVVGLPLKDFLATKQELLPKYLKLAASSTDAMPITLNILKNKTLSVECLCKISLIVPVDNSNSPCLLLRLDKPCQQENVFLKLNSELETLRQKYHELKKQKDQLTNYVKERTQRLYQEIKERKEVEKTLMQAEKMAALGSLVSGVAHEINTPIGIGVTGSSHLEDISLRFKKLFSRNAMKKSDLNYFLEDCEETSRIIHSNLQRASDLIHSFKQVAVDQSSEKKRRFNLKSYLEDVLLSLYPMVKKTAHTVTLNCPENIELNSYPGAFSQILTNLIVNSLIHGFENSNAGMVVIDIETECNELKLMYKDDGIGMTEDQQKKVFDPFFTTKRGKGGSGLGMHVVYNLICKKLFGTIECCSSLGKGVSYLITIPLDQPII